MGLITSSTSTDEGLLTGQNSDVRDVLNLSFVELESRINMAANQGANTIAGVAPNFQNNQSCMPSYQRDPSNLSTILSSSAASCSYGAALQTRLPIATATAADPTVLAVQAPLNQYTDIRVYVSAITGKKITMEARATGRGMNVTLQKQIILN